MKRRSFVGVVAACGLLLAVAAPAAAQDATSRRLLNFQGQLTNASGQPLTGAHDITVRFYDQATEGVLLFGETFTGVVLDRGVYNVAVGSTAPLSTPLLTAADVWMETAVDGRTLSPRRHMAASLFGMNADLLDGIDGGSFALADHSHESKIPYGYGQWYESHWDSGCLTNENWIDPPARSITYTKKQNDTVLLVSYADNLRTVSCNGGSSASCTYAIFVDGYECSNPSQIQGSVYIPQTDYCNPHRMRSINGVCKATAAGPLLAGNHTIRIRTRVTNGYSGTRPSCWMGWNSTTYLQVEELPAPQ